MSATGGDPGSVPEIVRVIGRPIRGAARRVRSALLFRVRTTRAEVALRRLRAERDRARQAGPITRILLYAPANLNTIDGSAIWVETVAATLVVGPTTFVTIPLKAPERRTILSDALRRLPRVEVLPVWRLDRSRRTPLEIEEALDWIERLDDEDPFDAFLLRGFELSLAASARPRLAGRIWGAYILEPERDVDAPEYLARIGEIARASAHLVAQTDEMRAATEERVPDARGRIVLIPPAVPESVPRAHGTPVARLVYTGKFAPFYPVPDLIDAFDRIRRDHPDLRFHIVGDKVWKRADDLAYAEALDARVSRVPGIVWHGGLSRSATAELLATGGIALNVWDFRHGSHWNDFVVSTKLLDYCAAGLPVILNRTVVQEQILGRDYPLFVDDVGEAEAMIRRVLADPDLYLAAGRRCWEASRRFTYRAVHDRLAAELAASDLGEERRATAS